MLCSPLERKSSAVWSFASVAGPPTSAYRPANPWPAQQGIKSSAASAALCQWTSADGLMPPGHLETRVQQCTASAEGLQQDSCSLQTRASCALSLIVRPGRPPLGPPDQVPDTAIGCTCRSRGNSTRGHCWTDMHTMHRTDQPPPALSQQWSSRALSAPFHMREGPQQWDHAAAQPSPVLLRPPAPGWLPVLQSELSLSCTGICINAIEAPIHIWTWQGDCCRCALIARRLPWPGLLLQHLQYQVGKLCV